MYCANEFINFHKKCQKNQNLCISISSVHWLRTETGTTTMNGPEGERSQVGEQAMRQEKKQVHHYLDAIASSST
jgi:hypothetical protein